METEKQILLIRLKSIGDVLFTLPAVHRLRAGFPQARLSFLVAAENAPLVDGFGAQAVLTLDRAAFRSGNPFRIARAAASLWRQIRFARPDVAIDFQGYGETALLSWLSRAPERWGSVYRPSRRWAYTRPIPRDDRIHPAEFNLRLLDACGAPPSPVTNRFTIPDPCLEEARRWLAEHRLQPAERLLIAQPITSSPHKNWPLEKYLDLARRWRERGFKVIFSGGPADRIALGPAQAQGYAVSAGTPLLVSAGLTTCARLVVGGDTGLLHLAVAAGKRVVMLMQSLGPGSTHPFQHPEWAVTPSPGQPLRDLAVDRVDAACQDAL